jgi:CHASE2 domain-containing sensor protein
MPNDSGTAERLTKYRERLLETAVLTVPLGLISTLGNAIQKSALGAPWRILWIVVPLAVAGWLTYRFIKRDPTPLRHWRWALLFGAFSSLFAVLSVSDLLLWRTIAAADRTIAARPWMLPVRAGDWHYWFARPLPPDPDALVVVMLEAPPGATTEELRRREAEVIRLAQQAEQVIGIGFDVFFVGPSAADAELCDAIVASNLAVFSGYTRQVVDADSYVELPARPPLPCQPRSQQGHLLGFADADGRVRAQQLWFRSTGDQPSFSLIVAQAIQERFRRTATAASGENILRYLPPADRKPPLTLEQLAATPTLLNNKFLLVGIQSPLDRFDTPFGQLPGTIIQAYAVHSLLTDRTITRASPFWSAAMVFATCYVLLLFATQRRSSRFLLLSAGLMSVLVVAAAALSMLVWHVWVEVVYCLTAVWLWLTILLVARRRLLVVDPQHPQPSTTAIAADSR